MNRALLAAFALSLLAAASVANAASTRAPASPVDRALCAAGLKSHCQENATSTNPVIINRRTLCPAQRCLDNASITNPVIINR